MSSPDIVEQQLTSVLEGACSQMSQLKKISSVSNYNSGYIKLKFDKAADIQYKQFELAAIIRQIYSKLPPSSSYPTISGGINGLEQLNPLLVYSVNGPLQPYSIKKESEAVFLKAFAGLKGIKEARILSAENLQVTISFDKDKCNAWHIKPSKIINSIQSNFALAYPGNINSNNGEQYFLQIPIPEVSLATIENIVLPIENALPVCLKDIAKIYIEEQEPLSYFRINGKNAVNLSIFAREGENKIVLGRKAKEVVGQLKKLLPNGFEVILDYDDTEFLEKEIFKNFRRGGLSICILVLFISLAYRSWQYLINLFSGLLVSMCLTAILAWLFKLDVNLYTISGLAISFGIMIDNAIVMIDYYYQWRNRKIFLALLAANLTTVAALSLVFFLPEEERRNLIDFSGIIVLALVSSLVTAFWFTPNLYLLTNNSRKDHGETSTYSSGLKQNKKWELQLLHFYYIAITFFASYRKMFILLILVAFGLPVFMLPPKWEGNHWYNRWYNGTIGSENYQENIKPKVDKWLGGALRLFITEVYEKSGYRNPEKTKLYVNAELPFGNTPDQLNHILADFEEYLSTVEGIDMYVTNVYSGQIGSIEINFKKGYDTSTLPYQLKSKLIARSLDWGGVEWKVYGVGQGFSNAGWEETPSFQVTMKGYNYNELKRQANRLADKLLKNKRIQKVNTNERLDYSEKRSREYILNLDARQMALHNTNRYEILNRLSDLSKPIMPSTQVVIGNQFYPVMLEEKESDRFSNYEMMQHSLQLDSNRTVRIGNIGRMELLSTSNSIHKEDRQYLRVVGFEYTGLSQYGFNYLEEVLTEMKKEMPVGYSAEQLSWNLDFGKTMRKYAMILALIAVIFFICSVLFENLKEPFFIICMIPISYIGLFLIFSFGKFYFDQGGYAAFVLLGGLVTNAAIFVVNDFNILRKKKSPILYNWLLVKATVNRARTILLTTISTSCGLIPFLMEGQNEVFWFSLAAGTIGGLFFSLIAVFVVLPILLWKKRL